jgi:hypothetical protein
MRGLARQRFLLPVFILSGMNLVLPVFGEAVAEISSEKDGASGTARQIPFGAKYRF